MEDCTTRCEKEINSSMLNFLREKIKTAQDKDVEDRKGTQPKRYYAKDAEGDEMSKSTKDDRAAHFAKNSKKADDDSSAYEPAPGDASAKTKPSKYTKAFKKEFGENKEVKKVLSKIKGLTKDQLAVISAMNPSTLTTVINQLSNLMMGEELEEAMKGSDRSYLEKRHKMLDQLQDKIIRMRDLDRDLKNKANKAVGQARFAIEDLLDADEMNEKLDANSDAGDYIDDFRKSDAPQFKGKSDKKIRQMAIAAYLDKKDGK